MTHASQIIAVTGGAGFIGANLVQRLLAERCVERVIVIDDLSTGDRRNVPDDSRVDLRVGSILDPEVLGESIAGCDSIVHLAAVPSVPKSVKDPVTSHAANATGTLNVLEAARRCGVGHVVVASSSSVYGDTDVLPKHEDLPCRPRSPYAGSKLAAEGYALAYGASYGLATLPLRFFNVFGPGQASGHAYAAVVPAFVAAASEGRPLPLHGDGRQTRDFTFVGSVVDLLWRAVERRLHSSAPVNLAFGTRTSLLQLAAELEQVMGRPLAREHLDPRAGDVRDSQASFERLRSLVPDATPVDLRIGLEATVRWFAEAQPRPWTLVPLSASPLPLRDQAGAARLPS